MNMNKLTSIFVFFLITVNISVSAQSDGRFYDSEQTYKKGVERSDPGGGGTDIGGDDPVPIDDYIPLLLAAALGMAVWYARRPEVKAE